MTTIMLNILESADKIPHPLALVLAYPAIDFNYNSWMTPQDLQVLRTEQSTRNIPGIIEGKDHMRHKSPLSVVDDSARPRPTPSTDPLSRKSSWHRSLSGRFKSSRSVAGGMDVDNRRDEEKTLRERVKTPVQEISLEALQQELQVAAAQAIEQKESHKEPIGTRLTMTSRTGYFQDRIISPTMVSRQCRGHQTVILLTRQGAQMRAMAILYIGPRHNPDFATDYYISPVLTPEVLLAQFPRTYLICGERDPFVDDTVILAGRMRQAKLNKREEARRKVRQKLAQARSGLRMSKSDAKSVEEDPILEEDEEDWLSMRIIEGWGHGFVSYARVCPPTKIDPNIARTDANAFRNEARRRARAPRYRRLDR